MDEYSDPDRPRTYIYKSVNGSLVDKYVLRYWWPLAMRLVPAKASANAVSILGNAGVWLSFAILSGLLLGPMPEYGRVHPWIFGIIAFCLFFYQTLDALDGIQARRTGTAGPLGEFVDHWFDSFNSFLLPLGLGLAFPSVPFVAVVALVLLITAADWTLLRIVQDTDTLVFPALSSEEGQVLLQLFFLAVWIFGYDTWNNPVLLGHSVAFWIFTSGIVGVSAILVQSIRSAKIARDLGLALFSLLPVSMWTFIAFPRYGLPALLAGCLLQGLSGSRFVGELLRVRLTGLRYKPLMADVLAMDALLLMGVLIPGMPSWLAPLTVLAALGWTAIRLGFQFSAVLARIRLVLGVGLWAPLKSGIPAGGKDSEASR